jgi:hypothetical protein
MGFSSKPKENPSNLLSFQFWTHVKKFIHYFKSRINLYIWMKFHLHLLEKVKKLRKTNQEEILNVIDIGLLT